jgi:hypothetical protein
MKERIKDGMKQRMKEEMKEGKNQRIKDQWNELQELNENSNKMVGEWR